MKNISNEKQDIFVMVKQLEICQNHWQFCNFAQNCNFIVTYTSKCKK